MKELKFPKVFLSDEREVDLSFRISKDDTTNKIRGGKLLVNVGMSYYADTLLRDYNKWLGGERLCIDGGSGLCVLNMREIIDFILKNRYDIETALKGNFDNKPKEILE